MRMARLACPLVLESAQCSLIVALEGGCASEIEFGQKRHEVCQLQHTLDLTCKMLERKIPSWVDLWRAKRRIQACLADDDRVVSAEDDADQGELASGSV